jgi:hypothetical protein
MRLISETKTTGVYQNISGSSTNTGFFLYGFPEYNIIRPGWTCVETGAIVTVVGDGISNYDITTVGTPFASGGFYSFTGPTGLELLGGMTFKSPKPSLIIATSDTGGLIGWSPQSLAIVYNAAIMSTYPVGSTITFQDGSTATITAYDPYAPNYIDIFWDTPKTGTLFPIRLSNV